MIVPVTAQRFPLQLTRPVKTALKKESALGNPQKAQSETSTRDSTRLSKAEKRPLIAGSFGETRFFRFKEGTIFLMAGQGKQFFNLPCQSPMAGHPARRFCDRMWCALRQPKNKTLLAGYRPGGNRWTGNISFSGVPCSTEVCFWSLFSSVSWPGRVSTDCTAAGFQCPGRVSLSFFTPFLVFSKYW